MNDRAAMPIWGERVVAAAGGEHLQSRLAAEVDDETHEGRGYNCMRGRVGGLDIMIAVGQDPVVFNNCQWRR